MRIAIILSLFVFVGLGAFIFAPGPKSAKTKLSFETYISSKKSPALASLPTEKEGRKISSNDNSTALSELQAASAQPWQISTNESGLVTRMSSGSLFLSESDPALAAHKFLSKYGKSLFGIPLESASLANVNNDATNPQAVFEQYIDGKKVYGTRISFIFDRSGSLVYSQSEVCPSNEGGEFIQNASAVQIARAGLLAYLKLPAYSELYPQELFTNSLDKAYRCVGSQLFSIFHFIIPLSAPYFGDMEIEVDGRSGSITQMRNLAKK